MGLANSLTKYGWMAAIGAAALLAPKSANAGVMMQGFYWDVPSGWYTTLQGKANELGNIKNGTKLNRQYFPPPSKAQGGGYSMGYDVADYQDVGNYNQHGGTNTRFGSKSQLTSCTTAYRNKGIVTMADIVLNHRSGGGSEYNPNTGGNTWTNFGSQASGFAKWHYNQFHPSTTEAWDEGAFGGFPDVCHTTGNSVGQPYKDQIDWCNWLINNSNAGFNGGWRYDYVKGFHTWYASQHRSAAGNNWAVGEYWDANTNTLNWWVNATGCSAFDFASYYTMRDIMNNTGGGGWLPNLFNHGMSFAAKYPTRAVTFAGNHDTDEIWNDKMMSYAYMLSYQGYPCLWYKDYYNYGLATLGGQSGNGIKQLVWVREKLGQGSPTMQINKSDDGDCIIFSDNAGTTSGPGYVTVINDNANNWRGAWVNVSNTYLRNKNLQCYAWYSSKGGQNYQPNTKFCDGNGWVEPWAAPRGYAVYAPTGY